MKLKDHDKAVLALVISQIPVGTMVALNRLYNPTLIDIILSSAGLAVWGFSLYDTLGSAVR